MWEKFKYICCKGCNTMCNGSVCPKIGAFWKRPTTLSSGCISYERRVQSCDVLRWPEWTHLCVLILHSTGASSRLRVVTLRTSRYTWAETRKKEMERAARYGYTFVSKHLHKAFKIFTLWREKSTYHWPLLKWCQHDAHGCSTRRRIRWPEPDRLKPPIGCAASPEARSPTAPARPSWTERNGGVKSPELGGRACERWAWAQDCTFIITRVSVSTSRMVSSYSTNVGNTWKPAKPSRKPKIKEQHHQSRYQPQSVCVCVCLTNRGKEDDGEEISDWLHASHDVCCDHVTLRGQQSSCQETAQLHGNIQKLCHLQEKKQHMDRHLAEVVTKSVTRKI